MATITELHVNGARRGIDADAERPLLSVLRDDLDLTGSKYGCGEGRCGACTVLIDGRPARSCTTPVSAAAGKPIRTIEGLASGDRLHPLQQAFLAGGCPAVRLLHLGHDHVRPALSDPATRAEPGRHRPLHGRQRLPLRHLSADRDGHPAGGQAR